MGKWQTTCRFSNRSPLCCWLLSVVLRRSFENIGVGNWLQYTRQVSDDFQGTCWCLCSYRTLELSRCHDHQKGRPVPRWRVHRSDETPRGGAVDFACYHVPGGTGGHSSWSSELCHRFREYRRSRGEFDQEHSCEQGVVRRVYRSQYAANESICVYIETSFLLSLMEM